MDSADRKRNSKIHESCQNSKKRTSGKKFQCIFCNKKTQRTLQYTKLGEIQMKVPANLIPNLLHFCNEGDVEIIGGCQTLSIKTCFQSSSGTWYQN